MSTCPVCGWPPGAAWAQLHGRAVCTACGSELIQADGDGSGHPLADTTIVDGHQPGLATTLEDSIESLVRTAHEEWTQIERVNAATGEAPASRPSLNGDGDGQPPRKMVSWADIEAFAEAATDIGPQIRTELARYHLPRPEPEPLITPISAPRKWPDRVMVAAGVGALIALGLFRLTHGPTGAGPVHPSSLAPSGVSSVAPSVSSHQSAARPAPRPGLRAALRITSRCWLRASADGRVIRQETLPAGQRVTFHAKKRLELVLGNAGGVTLRVNGKLMPTGRPGQVVQLAFTWRDGLVIGS